MTDDNELLELAAKNWCGTPSDPYRALEVSAYEVPRLISEKRSEAARADLTGFMLAWVVAATHNMVLWTSQRNAPLRIPVELDEAQAPVRDGSDVYTSNEMVRELSPRIIEPVTPETVFRVGDRVKWVGTEKWVGIRNITKAGNVMLSNRYLFRKDQMAQSFDRIERAPPMSREEIEGLVTKLSDQRHLMQGDGLSGLMETASTAAQALTALLAENERLRGAITEACDLLAERTYGNRARSPGHNARLRLEVALNKDPDQ